MAKIISNTTKAILRSTAAKFFHLDWLQACPGLSRTPEGLEMPIMDPEIEAWCEENFEADWELGFHDIIYFMSERDAVLFRLTWSHVIYD